jgi:transposase
MWTEITRQKYEREGQRYASDLTDAEWALIEPHMPAAKRFGPAARRIGRDLVSCPDRLLVANAAEGLSAVHYRARLFLRLARQRLV